MIKSELPEEEKKILGRFAIEFERTYTRFRDLQKAEAQAREAKIEAALERVRSRTMAMQRSAELAEVATVLFQQVKALGVPQWTCGFSIFEIDDKEFTWYPGSADGEILPPNKIPLTEHPVFISFNESRKRGDELFVYEKGGEFQADHYRYMRSLPGGEEMYQNTLKAGITFPAFQVDHIANFSHGNLVFITYEHFPEMHDVFKRFAKVFDQTYTRFLDLQKAEAQAREAKIETALEKVRSRTMAMQRSDELADVAMLLFQQVKELGITAWTTGFNIWQADNASYIDWITGPTGDFLEPYSVDCTSHPVFRAIREARQRGEDFFVSFLEGEQIVETYELLNSFGDKGQFQKMLDSGIHFPTRQFNHFVFGAQVSLLFITYEPCPEGWDVFKRFGKVFEQTYTRFLDLKKAEAQARDAVKRASVDRVRAEIASMRTTSDLERITPLIWNELTTLGVPFIRCGVFIMDEEQQQVQSFLSTPDGKAIAAFHQPFNTPGEIAEVIKSWHKKEMYRQHWDETQFIEFAKNLVEQGAIKSGEKYLTENRPTDLYLHFLPFLQGMLYAGSTTAFGDDELQLVQNLADAFSTAYARYEDFNKLESANVKIEKTLVDLKQTQAQLVQSEKMASLGELTAGIAHEIQNPLNFVNNFSELNKELLGELNEEIEKGNYEEVKIIAQDVTGNEEKISHHGKRADAIVKGMLQHSRSSSATKEPTDINKLADEYLRLAYHGLRAKDNAFNATMKTDYDTTIGDINIIPPDIGRVLLNLYNNAFYAVSEKKKDPQPRLMAGSREYEPTVTVSTKSVKPPPTGGGLGVLISVKDNGNGIPQKVVDKIFQPFFTTKPTGQGTGLGLSLSYDIIKAHGGEIKVETREGEGSEFIIMLPIV
jgi:signal transduction histidine kinase